MMVSVGHFSLIWLDLMTCHTNEINVTTASQCAAPLGPVCRCRRVLCMEGGVMVTRGQWTAAKADCTAAIMKKTFGFILLESTTMPIIRKCNKRETVWSVPLNPHPLCFTQPCEACYEKCWKWTCVVLQIWGHWWQKQQRNVIYSMWQ